MSDVVGVLALQGAFEKHIEMLSALGVENQRVRYAHELDECSALIIPGGESTTMSLLIQKFELYKKLQEFAAEKPVMGVCAGAILMAETVDDARVIPLKIMPMTAARNNYGRQVCSFSTDLDLECDAEGLPYQAHFIRAPGLTPNSDKIEKLASYNGEPVMMRSGRHMALAFHPELTKDSRIHECWLKRFHPSFQ
ncbi:MAG: pyridoxal 5'-phosphate synthase glutaminase subunit PdxT [Gammaproteobacteria bacterium]|nr:pyridoxal 5'-phosphate synthase glutaminase subunit PdxT [Gammaproteobacteria bacterium]MCW8924230.1 pyridoxal 5'-phosphate synthase glutaminase subunit PdxT [Gammaproteobacteria bacterium]